MCGQCPSTAGTFIDGLNAGPPSAPTGAADDSMFLNDQVVRRRPFPSGPRPNSTCIRGVSAPGSGDRWQITGFHEVSRDNVDAVTARLPLVLTVIGVVTFMLMFLLTGSVVLPIKTLVLNVLS